MPVSHGRPNQRLESRTAVALTLPASVDGLPRMLDVRDISHTGFLVEAEPVPAVGQTIELELPHGGPTTARVVWAGETVAGCNFTDSITRGVYSAALLKSEVVAQPDKSDTPAAPAEPARALDKVPLSVCVAVAAATALGWMPLLAYAWWR